MARKRLLLKLAKMLIADAKNEEGLRFDLGVVGRSIDYGSTLSEPQNYKPSLSCGTTGCAMGLAALSGEFKKEGLSYKRGGFNKSKIYTTFNGRELDYDHAAARLFGISLGEATWLFSPWKYPIEKRRGAAAERLVAKRIKHLVTRGVSKKTLYKIY